VARKTQRRENKEDKGSMNGEGRMDKELYLMEIELTQGQVADLH
jgi:hypothetical protein